jgi:hypothetical protein
MVTKMVKQAASGKGGIFIVNEDSEELLRLEKHAYENALLSLQLTLGQSASLADAKSSKVKARHKNWNS